MTIIQDQIRGNHCFGCSPDNPHGHHIKSAWDGERAICHFAPEPWHCAGSPHYVYGGLIASVIDCHCICTAMAEAYQREGRAIGEGENILYVTGQLNVSYLRAAPIAGPLVLEARVTEAGERKSRVTCSLAVNGEECARAELVAVRVPASWGEAEAG
ncbi:PaaI family thioesterase [Parahaliea mediterranea]|uniref:PaaI family thioesterase n=1 Tax=Parahaliea mediterranea TaxID=651086 RepID=A0A939DFH7_9GAMM|nr:PaaI family thioesterase [Parahaliea mediterranea]MBN7797288.1 PaaI family thioesterase [Parahaliea mediterranea]